MKTVVVDGLIAKGKVGANGQCYLAFDAQISNFAS